MQKLFSITVRIPPFFFFTIFWNFIFFVQTNEELKAEQKKRVFLQMTNANPGNSGCADLARSKMARHQSKRNKFPIGIGFEHDQTEQGMTALNIQKKMDTKFHWIKNMEPNPASFCLFSSFSQYIDRYTRKFWLYNGVLGIRTRDRSTVGADESTELWRHPHWITCSKDANLSLWSRN